jgi:hypothetical protein
MPVIGILIGWLTELWMGFYVGIAGIAFSQIMSTFFHLPVKQEKWYLQRKRKNYIRLLLLLLIMEFTGLVAFFFMDQNTLFEVSFASMCILCGTFLTIYYWNICFLEIQIIQGIKS